MEKTNIPGAAEGVVEQAKHTAASVAEHAKEGLSHDVESGRDKAVETIENVSGALRSAGEKLEGTGPLPDFVEKAADGVERLAHYLEGKSIGDLVRGAESFARREPALFLGGALAVGVVAGRFLKSSAPRRPTAPAPPSDYGFAGEERYETYGYEGDYGGDDLLGGDELQDDWDSMEETLAFEAEAGDLRTTQPQGSSPGAVGVGAGARGGTAPMPATPGGDALGRTGR